MMSLLAKEEFILSVIYFCKQVCYNDSQGGDVDEFKYRTQSLY